MDLLRAPKSLLEPDPRGSGVLLVTENSLLLVDLQDAFRTLGFPVTSVSRYEEALAIIRAVDDLELVLLDSRCSAVADGRLLEEMHPWGVHRRSAIVAVANHPDEAWIARLRAELIDDIVPEDGDARAWRARLSAIRRNRHRQAELETLRVIAGRNGQQDEATRVLHRDVLLRSLFRETDRVQRLHSQLSMILIAIDGWDRWKPETGVEGCDGLLGEAAKRTAKMLRSYDLLGRVGEAEFLAVLPGCTPDNALELANRMRIDVFGEPFRVLNERREPMQVWLCASFAVVPSRGRSPLVVLREAEKLIEQVRRQGVGLLPEPEIDRTMEKPAAGVQRGAAADRRGKPARQIPLLGMSDGRHES